jgi:hypothetical protein
MKPFHDDKRVRDNSHCRFIEQRGDRFYCILRERYDSGQPLKVPKRYAEYFLTQCLPFPNEDEEDHKPPVYDFPAFCGFKWVRDDADSD